VRTLEPNDPEKLMKMGDGGALGPLVQEENLMILRTTASIAHGSRVQNDQKSLIKVGQLVSTVPIYVDSSKYFSTKS
jgi:hypothetical protein